MLKKSYLLVSLILVGCSQDSSYIDEKNKEKGILLNITEDNDDFVKDHKKEDFQSMFDGQTPRVVVLGCADSRFHTHAIDKTPENDIFMARNIGNVYDNNSGSVMYAVKHLHTPVVLVIGHDSCGAVTAATKGVGELEKDIQKELKNIKVSVHSKKPSEADIKGNVEENVHYQIGHILKDFKKEIKDKKLDVLGAVYDFKNVYGKGYGALVFVNWNGQKEGASIESKAKELGLNKMKIH